MSSPKQRTRVVLIETPTGRATLEGAPPGDGPAAAAWDLNCDRRGGPWAGLRDLLLGIYPEVRRDAPELIDHHAYELTAVLPELRGEVAVPTLSLLELSKDAERVRNYAMDRAFRIVHGLVDLLAQWHQRQSVPWRIRAQGFSQAGALNRRLFRELVRRYGQQLDLELTLVVTPEDRETLETELESIAEVTAATAPTAPPSEAEEDEATWERRTAELEASVGDDLDAKEIHYPALIDGWLRAGQPQRALRWQAFALGICNHRGFYEDALTYVPPVLAGIDDYCGSRQDVRWNVVGNVFNSLTAVGRSEEAQQVVERYAVAAIDDPAFIVRICYVQAMLHVRYLPQSDLPRAEAYLLKALDLLDEVELPEDERHFQQVFVTNGLAFVRHRQGRPQEAIELCHSGFRRLQENLGEERHRLHRSVLLYNIAQVLTGISALEEAVAQFGRALEMDPNFPEYYNERGSILLKLGRLEEAERDFRAAMACSPPYPEVWTNLGQCYRLKGDAASALAAYDRAIDLEPDQLLARIGRAQVLEQVGNPAKALADYDRALSIEPDQPLLLANRAVLHFERGAVPAALRDLDHAVRLAPDNGDLYRNRAVALQALDREQDAAADLRSYLRLQPDAADTAEVQLELAALEVAD